MNKTLYTLLLLASAIVANAQSLTGKQWSTMIAGGGNGDNVAVALTFENDGSCEIVVGAEYEMKVDGVPITIVGGISVPGSYSLSGKNLTMNLHSSQAEVDIDYEVKGMDARAKAVMDEQVRPDIEASKGEFKKAMLDHLPTMHNLKIVSLESKRLVVKDDANDEITFNAE